MVSVFVVITQLHFLVEYETFVVVVFVWIELDYVDLLVLGLFGI